MRKTRIDELPQILNVFKGEMSFVGPRPERAFFVEQLIEVVPYYNVRHSIKPGITGWAQVRYGYGSSAEDALQKLQYDLYYVKNNSLFLDFLILIDTLKVVLFRGGRCPGSRPRSPAAVSRPGSPGARTRACRHSWCILDQYCSP
jgi:lipopolysaccharide/colanic/teichoic acid biosynthesis glycosyltransferase